MIPYDYTTDDNNDNAERIDQASGQLRNPIDYPAQISNTMWFTMDYKNRKHLFLFSPVSLTILAEDYITSALTIAANTWVNLGFPAGVRIVAGNQSTPIYVYLRATDETIP